MAIYNYKKGASPARMTLSKAELNQMTYITTCAKAYLDSKPTAQTVQNNLGSLTPANVKRVFGIAEVSTIASRSIDIYGGLIKTSRETVAKATGTGASNFSSITDRALDNGAKSVTVDVSYYEVTNASTGVTVLTYPIAVNAIVYNM